MPVTLTYELFTVAREEIVGFYSSGPKIKENDIKVRYVTQLSHSLNSVINAAVDSLSFPPILFTRANFRDN
jgi:hypothetical protein